VKLFEVAAASTPDVAERVLPAPAVPEMVTALKVATPDDAFTVAVPFTVAPVPARVIAALEPVTVLELESITRTETAGEKLLPTATVALGCWTNARAVAAPGLSVKLFEAGAVSTPDVADSVFPAPEVPENVTELNVATPDEAFTVAVPLTVTPEPPSVIAALDPVTVFALASTTRTETGVAKLFPTATVADGCCTNASAVAVPGFRVKALEVAPVSPVDAAERVFPAPAVPLTGQRVEGGDAAGGVQCGTPFGAPAEIL
jgi:hypothetical protein